MGLTDVVFKFCGRMRSASGAPFFCKSKTMRQSAGIRVQNCNPKLEI
jgi:hypothetical protein